MDLYLFVIILGIIAYTFVLITALSGLRVIKLNYKSHRMLGILSVVGASFHALLILYLTIF